MRKFLRRMDIKTYPVDIWVDRDGVVRKLAVELEYKLPDGEYVRTNVTEEYYGFGVVAGIEPPPARSVIDVTPRLRGDAHRPRRLSS
jgi:hypothetical protein